MALLSILCLLVSAQVAPAQDTAAQLAQAESDVADATSAVAGAEQDVASAEQALGKAASPAERASVRAESALARVQTIEETLVEQRIDAAAKVEALEAAYAEDSDEHSKEREFAIGVALAALGLGLLALAWSGFRSMPVVARLAAAPLAQVVGILSGALIALLVVGAALTGVDGVGRVLGAFITLLAPGVVVALLIARHSTRVERGVGQPIVSRKRYPRWVAIVLAALLLLIFAGGLGNGIAADAPDRPVISEGLRELAEAAEDDPAEPATARLSAAIQRAEPLVEQAEKLDDVRAQAQERLSEARERLTEAKNRLADANQLVSTLSRRLARETEQAAAQAAAAAAAAAEPPSSGGGGGGAPSSPDYSSCATAPDNISVPPGSPLDGDGDGVGCES